MTGIGQAFTFDHPRATVSMSNFTVGWLDQYDTKMAKSSESSAQSELLSDSALDQGKISL